jgi:purine-nucleoside phosphorylase
MTMKRIQKKSEDLFTQVHEAVLHIKSRSNIAPDAAIILGTGLGQLADRIKDPVVIPYGEIPHFPQSTVESHAGKLILGTLSGKHVAVMQGRFHFYEGYTMQDITFPVRVLKMIGADALIVSNAAGGLNLGYRKGEIILLEDMINFMGANPLVGYNDDRLGPRFPDMSCPFSAKLIGLAEEAAREEKISVRRGVYIGVAGPNLETRAEYRMMRNWGADVVGMSTVPETIVGVHMGMEILGLSVVTDVCDPDHLAPVNIQEIIKTANEAGPKLDKLVLKTLSKI